MPRPLSLERRRAGSSVNFLGWGNPQFRPFKYGQWVHKRTRLGLTAPSRTALIIVGIAFVVWAVLVRNVFVFNKEKATLGVKTSTLTIPEHVQLDRNDSTDSYYPRISVWRPKTAASKCTGAWNSAVARPKTSLPYFMIRDALIDRRHASVEEFGRMYGRGKVRFFTRQPPPFVRLVFYVSVHLSVKLNEPGKKAKNGTDIGAFTKLVLENSKEGVLHSTTLQHFIANDVVARVDYVIHSTDFRIHKGAYKPGTHTARTKDKKDISEWQVVISLSSKTRNSVADWEPMLFAAARAGAKLWLRFPMTRFDGKNEVYSAAMPLQCVTGWEEGSAIPRFATQLRKRPRNCRSARGAVALLGSPLHGKKKTNNVRDIAHFAARSLLGPLPFETVVVTVVPEKTLVQIHNLCGSAVSCIERYELENARALQNLVKLSEKELEFLGVPRSLFPNVIIVPFCRFGSDYNGTERLEACSSSFYGGQHHNLYFSYTLASPYHSWAAAMDLDEFFAPNMNRNGVIRRRSYIPFFSPPRTAKEVFDRYGHWRTRGAIRFSWLNFAMYTLKESRSITLDTMRSNRIPLRHAQRKESPRRCYRDPRIKNGKCAVSCQNGIGFTIHSAVTVKREGKLTETTAKTFLANSVVRAWHARWRSAMSPCQYGS